MTPPLHRRAPHFWAFLGGVLVILVAVSAYWSLRYRSGQEHLEALRTRAGELETELSKARSILARQETFEEEAARLDADLDQLERILPPALTGESMRARVEEASSEAGVQLLEIGPARSFEREFFVETTVKLEVLASLGTLGTFAESMEQRPQLMKITALDGAATEDGLIRGNVVVSAYSCERSHLPAASGESGKPAR